MPIHKLYIDFIEFLGELEKGVDRWDAYCRDYLTPNSVFLSTYWKEAGISLSQIRERVERVSQSDYSSLRALLKGVDLENLVERTIQRCGETLQAAPPDVYLFVGFFSSDGFVIQLVDRPVIGIGLERFRDSSNLRLILAHEYCHYCLRVRRVTSAITQGKSIFSEGASSLFSQQVYPEEPLHRHLFFTRSRLNSCIQTESQILRLLKGKSFPEMCSLLRAGDENSGVPPRAGNYISYVLVQEFVRTCEVKNISELLNQEEIGDLWNLFLTRKLQF
jgi:hypothetical protein